MNATVERIRRIVANPANEMVVIQVALDLGFTFPKTGREDWNDREDFDRWMENLLQQYEVASMPPMRGTSDLVVRVNKSARDARTFLRSSFPQVQTPEQLLTLLKDRGVSEV